MGWLESELERHRGRRIAVVTHHAPSKRSIGECYQTDQGSEWLRKGATLTDGTAAKEYGLTREQIYDAARAGGLQYRTASSAS